MPIITLPDGTEKSFERALSVFDVAKSIGSGLAKAALAGKVNGELVDVSYMIEADSALAIITDKDDEGLEVIRHSSAHLLAQATQMLYPEAQVTIGPVIDNGFYYDFAYKDGFSEADLAKIEKNMNYLVKQNLKIERSEMSRDEAIQFLKIKARFIRLRLLNLFLLSRLYHFINKAILLTFVAARMCLQPLSSKPLN